MNPKDTSSPAFPTTTDNGVNFWEYGMTLRDYFAAKAMQAHVSDSRSDRAAHKFQRDVSIIAYQQADAMLEARKS
jgi:hypothetical protein